MRGRRRERERLTQNQEPEAVERRARGDGRLVLSGVKRASVSRSCGFAPSLGCPGDFQIGIRA